MNLILIIEKVMVTKQKIMESVLHVSRFLILSISEKMSGRL